MLRLAFALGLSFALASSAGAEPPFRVMTEDASLFQCRVEICTTLQVTRSTFSNGDVETALLLFTHQAPNGDLIEIPGFPSGFTLIPSEAFFMNRQGTQATLRYLGASVAWSATDDFFSDSFSTEFIRQQTEDGIVKSQLNERSEQRSADAEGTVGPVVIDPGGIPPSEGFGSAFLIQRKSVSRTRLK